jgi:hypothetical protein
MVMDSRLNYTNVPHNSCFPFIQWTCKDLLWQWGTVRANGDNASGHRNEALLLMRYCAGSAERTQKAT